MVPRSSSARRPVARPTSSASAPPAPAPRSFPDSTSRRSRPIEGAAVSAATAAASRSQLDRSRLLRAFHSTHSAAAPVAPRALRLRFRDSRAGWTARQALRALAPAAVSPWRLFFQAAMIRKEGSMLHAVPTIVAETETWLPPPPESNLAP